MDSMDNVVRKKYDGMNWMFCDVLCKILSSKPPPRHLNFRAQISLSIDLTCCDTSRSGTEYGFRISCYRAVGGPSNAKPAGAGGK